jgi:hypothetical protein
MKFTLVQSKKTYATAKNAARAARIEGFETGQYPTKVPSGRWVFYKKVLS